MEQIDKIIAEADQYFDAMDYKKAIPLYKKVFETGNVESGFCFGVCYEKMKDYAKSVRWYKKAAEQGDEDAKQALEDMKNAINNNNV